MFCDKKEYINLIIEDDGVGLPKEIDIQKLESMGLRLVSNTITNDLGGSLEIVRTHGTRFIIRFKACEL